MMKAARQILSPHMIHFAVGSKILSSIFSVKRPNKEIASLCIDLILYFQKLQDGNFLFSCTVQKNEILLGSSCRAQLMYLSKFLNNIKEIFFTKIVRKTLKLYFKDIISDGKI